MIAPAPLPQPEADDTAVDHDVDLAQHALWLLLLLVGLYSSRLPSLYTSVAGVAGIDRRGLVVRGEDRKLLGKVERDVRKWHKKTYSDIRKQARKELLRLAAFEAGYQAIGPEYDATPNKLTRGQAKEAVDRVTFQGRTLDEHLEALELASADSVVKDIRESVKNGETIDDTLERVRGDKGTTEKARRDIKRLITTAATSTSNAVRAKFAEKNPDLIEALIHSSVLDSRTTRICIALAGTVYGWDGQAYRDDKGNLVRVPPLHWNCRSSIRMWVKGKPKPSIPTADDWLKRQSTGRQDEILGGRVAQLWRDGKIELRGLITDNLRPLSFDELRKRGRR